MLGQGKPMNESCAPSVPPRMARTLEGMWHAFMASSTMFTTWGTGSLFAHVVILVVDGDSHRALAIALVEPFGSLLHKSFALLEALAVVVAYDVAEGGVLHIALDAK